MTLAQLLVNGLALGAAYALVALGFVLIVNASGAVNFAHGDTVMVGGFVTVALSQALGWPGLALLPLVLLVMAAFGVGLAAVACLPLSRRPPVAVFISTIAVGLMLANAANGWFGAAPRAGPALVGGGAVDLVGVTVSRQSLAIMAAAAVLVTGFHLLLERTQLGRRMRAAAEDPEMARALGIPVAAMTALAFALGSALAGAAGLLLAHQFFVTPAEGPSLMIKAYIAATLAGWGRIGGAALGALAIAVFEVVVSAYLSYLAAEALLYGFVLLVLAIRPQGFFGEAAGRRA